MPPGTRTRGRRGAIRSGERASIGMLSILSGFEHPAQRRSVLVSLMTKCCKRLMAVTCTLDLISDRKKCAMDQQTYIIRFDDISDRMSLQKDDNTDLD